MELVPYVEQYVNRSAHGFSHNWVHLGLANQVHVARGSNDESQTRCDCVSFDQVPWWTAPPPRSDTPK